MRCIAYGMVACLAAALAGCDRSDGQIGMPRFGGSGSGPTADVGRCIIVLSAHRAETHAEDAMAMREYAREALGWENIEVSHHESHSQVISGPYPSPDKAEARLKQAKQLQDDQGVQRFALAAIKPLQGPSVGPPEWNLSNAPGTYTVQVAVFSGKAEGRYIGKKKAAVEYCRMLRKKGEQAYYYHGTAWSAVTIGSFPADAIVRVQRTHPDAAYGRPDRTVIRNRRIKQIMARYPDLMVNGYQEKVGGKPRATYPVRIPKQER